MDSGATEQCWQGDHYVYDDSTGKFKNTGPCEDSHEVDPRQQVVDAAQSAVNQVQGPGVGAALMQSMFPNGDPIQNLKNGLQGN